MAAPATRTDLPPTRRPQADATPSLTTRFTRAVEALAYPPNGELPFLLRWFHYIALAVVVVGMAVQVPMGVFAAQAPMDPVAHFVWPMATGSIAFQVMFADDDLRIVPSLIVITALGVGFEVLWEVAEFTGDHFLIFRHWQVDNADTMSDLIIGIFGAVVGASLHVGIERAA